MNAAAACPRPCSECPWRTENHGKPHPDGWYTKKNRTRLWAKLKLGESMSCHKTDPSNPVPAGVTPVAKDAQVHECTGALILQQREVMLFQQCAEEATTAGEKRGGFKRYRVAGGTMSLGALRDLVARALFGGTPFGGLPMTRPNLNEPVSR